MPTVYQSLEAELLFPLIPESGSFAVDVGANEGYWSRELIMVLTDTGYKIRVIPNPAPNADDYCWIHAR